MKNPKPNKRSLCGRVAFSSCSTPALQKNNPFCRQASIARRAYAIFRRRHLGVLGAKSIRRERRSKAASDLSENHTESKAANAMIPTTKAHIAYEKGARTFSI
mmetsp:Transcript_35828/g.66439  ORF Transcript_35828/g.66439 Transcript_35828/m.66439 type:complete len:103 (+) Transcript_35828:521-829(+)